MPTDKIKSVNELIKILGPLKKRGKRIVFTNGCFDILHKGHVKLLKKSKSFGDVLIVAINSDSSVKKIKGKNRPVNSAQDRAIVLSAIESVDYVTAFSEPDPARIIKRLGPDVLVKGGDWKKNKVIGSEFVTSRGGKVYSVPMAKGYSTSGMIKRIAKKQMNKKVLRVIDANANRLTEGIRVCEDVTRFVLDDKAKTKDFKSLRHKASLSLKNLNGDIKILAKFRDVDRDIGRKSTKNEARRKGISDIFKANIKRSEESARVLEEFFKIANPRRSNIFKSIRFQLYSLEKNIVKKLQALCNY